VDLHGGNILGDEIAKGGPATLRGVDPATGRALDPAFYEATDAEVARALEKAEEACSAYSSQPPDAVAGFLEAIAAGLDGLGAELLDRAALETGLPGPRLLSERGRTTGQLRMFAALVREGSWVDARIDPAQPDRKPLPRSDLRRMLVPMGPVAVFGASNFPLAFSVCGGDTASALAGGNPVVVKGHPAHPGTSEMAARTIQEAARACGMPAGVFSMVQGASPAVGLALVRHPATRAVAFTGSLAAGRALFNVAAERPRPIPVFAEMGSINPVFVLPGALKARGVELGQALGRSMTLGVGQFCTKPGLVVGSRGPELEGLVASLAAFVSQSAPGTMLHQGIAAGYRRGLEGRQRAAGLRLLARAATAADAPAAQAGPAVFATEARSFLADRGLHEELFGPATLVVECESRERLEEVARALDGQLTVTLQATGEDVREYASLVAILREKAGRLVFGGVPTGVEVSPAMQHGGPYPATTDPRFTSVGTAAILRFVRPVCYQDFPAAWLPPELQDGNPRGIWRLVDGQWTR
jgi:NADP-dependent aldehyde dehydrogenase